MVLDLSGVDGFGVVGPIAGVTLVFLLVEFKEINERMNTTASNRIAIGMTGASIHPYPAAPWMLE